uniref:Uncharacterized protein n=1 Tax=Zea mays TaxID=4577 RepID=A0A804R3E6_MAIZE
MPPLPHQMHSQVPNSFGLTHANAPQHMLQQPMFHPVANPQTNFLLGQPPLPAVCLGSFAAAVELAGTEVTWSGVKRVL